MPGNETGGNKAFSALVMPHGWAPRAKLLLLSISAGKFPAFWKNVRASALDEMVRITQPKNSSSCKPGLIYRKFHRSLDEMNGFMPRTERRMYAVKGILHAGGDRDREGERSIEGNTRVTSP